MEGNSACLLLIVLCYAAQYSWLHDIAKTLTEKLGNKHTDSDTYLHIWQLFRILLQYIERFW